MRMSLKTLLVSVSYDMMNTHRMRTFAPCRDTGSTSFFAKPSQQKKTILEGRAPLAFDSESEFQETDSQNLMQ